MLFDWQTLTKGLGAVDLAFFMLGGSPEARRRHERDLVERYHARLIAGGVAGYSFVTLLSDNRVALLRWWIGTVNGFGSPYASAWTGRQAQLALQSVQWWNAVSADHQLSKLMHAQ